LNNTNNCPIYVPDAAVEAYKTATNWSQYSDRIYPISVYEAGGIENLITFADPAVEAICLANWDTHGNGIITKAEAEAVTSVGTVFMRNKEITKFPELIYFTNVKSLVAYAMQECHALTTVDLTNMESLGAYAFNDCRVLTGDVSLPQLTGVLGTQVFYGTQITSIYAPLATGIQTNSLSGNNRLAKAEFGNALKSIGDYAFNNDSSFKVLIIRSQTPPSLSSSAFNGTNGGLVIYVPDEAVDTYKAASNWASLASRIKPLSEYTE
jgi:hypothetical protein